jgi:hypothetical protein
MLKRVRIEVEADTAADCVTELFKYEHALQATEAERYGLGYTESDFVVKMPTWATSIAARDFYNEKLGRVVTEEVIEYRPDFPGYQGRRVVQYNRIDTRHYQEERHVS